VFVLYVAVAFEQPLQGMVRDERHRDIGGADRLTATATKDMDGEGNALFVDTRIRVLAGADGREDQHRAARLAVAGQDVMRLLARIDAVEIGAGALDQSGALDRTDRDHALVELHDRVLPGRRSRR
jgi:hypothetical protein